MPCKKYAGHSSGEKGVSPSWLASYGPKRREGPGQLIDFKFIGSWFIKPGQFQPSFCSGLLNGGKGQLQ